MRQACIKPMGGEGTKTTQQWLSCGPIFLRSWQWMVKSQIPKNSGRTVNFPMNRINKYVLRKWRKHCGLEWPVKTWRRWWAEAKTLNLGCFSHSWNLLASRIKPQPRFQWSINFQNFRDSCASGQSVLNALSPVGLHGFCLMLPSSRSAPLGHSATRQDLLVVLSSCQHAC